MSLNDKYNRVYEILLELDILHIAHSSIGFEGSNQDRISGGERRRVSIGQDLSVLFYRLVVNSFVIQVS